MPSIPTLVAQSYTALLLNLPGSGTRTQSPPTELTQLLLSAYSYPCSPKGSPVFVVFSIICHILASISSFSKLNATALHPFAKDFPTLKESLFPTAQCQLLAVCYSSSLSQF